MEEKKEIVETPSSQSDELWDKVNGKGDLEIKRIVLLDYAKNYIEDPSEENFKRLKDELANSSGLSKSYVIGYLAKVKKNCEAVQELINATYNEKTENYVYDNELAEMIPENGESRKSRL